jgi:hypothetical protein
MGSRVIAEQARNTWFVDWGRQSVPASIVDWRTLNAETCLDEEAVATHSLSSERG